MSGDVNEQAIPLPRPTTLSSPHWDGCREGRLLVQRCDRCGHHEFIPQPRCTQCQSSRLTWVRSAGRGSVYSFTVVHRAPRPQFTTPYAVAIIEMAEGWYMLSNIVEVPPEEVTVGMPVRVVFRPMSEQITLPFFTRAD